jgi:hypothetical protein
MAGSIGPRASARLSRRLRDLLERPPEVLGADGGEDVAEQRVTLSGGVLVEQNTDLAAAGGGAASGSTGGGRRSPALGVLGQLALEGGEVEGRPGEAHPPRRGQALVAEGGEERHIAHLHVQVRQPWAPSRPLARASDLDVGGGIDTAEELGAGLGELAVAPLAGPVEAEDAADVVTAEGPAPLVDAVGVEPRRGNGHLRPQADLVAPRVGEDVHAAADLLAETVEEGRGAFEDGRLDGAVALAAEPGPRGLGESLGPGGLLLGEVERPRRVGVGHGQLPCPPRGRDGRDLGHGGHRSARGTDRWAGWLVRHSSRSACPWPALRGRVLDLHLAGLELPAAGDRDRRATPVGVLHLRLERALVG